MLPLPKQIKKKKPKKKGNRLTNRREKGFDKKKFIEGKRGTKCQKRDKWRSVVSAYPGPRLKA